LPYRHRPRGKTAGKAARCDNPEVAKAKKPTGSALAAFGLLLDRSLEQIAQAARDGRPPHPARPRGTCASTSGGGTLAVTSQPPEGEAAPNP